MMLAATGRTSAARPDRVFGTTPPIFVNASSLWLPGLGPAFLGALIILKSAVLETISGVSAVQSGGSVRLSPL